MTTIFELKKTGKLPFTVISYFRLGYPATGQQMMEKVRTKQQQQLQLEAAKKAAIEQLQNAYEQHKLLRQQDDTSASPQNNGIKVENSNIKQGKFYEFMKI